MRYLSIIFLFVLFTSVVCAKNGSLINSESFYKKKPADAEAVYFTPQNFKITTDGKTDITDLLQGAINKLKLEQNFGIIFIPEGRYLISKTIYVPAAIRLIGYGDKRPLIILKKHAPGYQVPVVTDKGESNYMFWFTSSVAEPSGSVNDAGAGTFYSALSNIDLKIDDENPAAVALRTHYAQHSFISHCDISIGQGKAGMFDVGNEMEDVRFYGGDYGIYTTKASPGWQFMMLDTRFEGQRKAAIKTREAGLTIIRMKVKNVPRVIEVEPNYWEKLYLEDCRFEHVTGPAISFEDEGNANMQINLRNIICQNVPVLINYLKSNRQTTAPGEIYNVGKYIYGLQIKDLDKTPNVETTFDSEILSKMPSPIRSDLPEFPEFETWVNLRTLGAKGDGITDDTQIIRNAIANYPTIYIPQGTYRISETLRLKPNTALIGLHPIATQFILSESTPAFSGFGSPVPMIESPQGGKNILSGIGLSTGEYNYRAVACKWMSGEKSMINDVKFVGGHGTMRKGPYVPWRGYGKAGEKPSPVLGTDPAWDTQYWSLWITNGGGGTFKNIWTASSYATSGIYVSNTSTPSQVYALSVEHHVRNEVRFDHVSNWKVFALQLEEESREGAECQPMELNNCSEMMFVNLYMFRVIRVKTPYPYSIRTWDCRNIEMLNIHNYSQVKYTTDNPLYDVNTNTEVRPQEFASLLIRGNTPKNSENRSPGPVKTLATGFEFAEGMCTDSKGNVYFAEQRMKRIYKWSAENNSLSLLADFPWEPLSLGCDSKDNLLVVFRYNPQFGHLINGVPEKYENPVDASGTSFSGWGNSGFGTLVYSLDPNHPDETIQLLDKVPMNSVRHIFKALYPSNRWRDGHDFNAISVNKNESCFIAPDGVTIIPACYDLARATSLIEAIPGKPLYATDEYNKRTVRMDVDDHGYLSNLTYFAEKGEFNAIPDSKGDVYVADGEMYIYNSKGEPSGMIPIPERPSSIAFGGKERKILFITGRKTLYSVNP
ncbi:MAG: glycosyl hydrolase family 28-related protein [Mariniphaga sp.]